MTIQDTLPEVERAATDDGLGDQLRSRRWVRRYTPFPHLLAYDVFIEPVYKRLEASFLDAISQTQGRPYLEKHDIAGRTLTADVAALFEPLATRWWNDLLAGLLGIETTGHLACGMHHHDAGSSHGFSHNDFNPGWFNGACPPGEVRLGDGLVNYMTGEPLGPGAEPIQTVRAASMLYYLGNPPWAPGDGGMTGLYGSGIDDITHPVAAAPPINNSLLLFECTPNSYHGFISNVAKPRNSIVMWLHQSVERATGVWGVGSVVNYGETPALRRTR